MNTKVKNTVVAAVTAALASTALALSNAGLMACIDEGASSAKRRSQQETLLVSTTPPGLNKSREAASHQTRQTKEQQLKRELEALGIWVD